MAEFEIKESNFVSGKELNGKTDLSIKILNEVKAQPTEFGAKPTGKVLLGIGSEKVEKEMRFNQIFINYLIDKTGSTDSLKWVDFETPVEVKMIKGNLSVVPKGVVQ